MQQIADWFHDVDIVSCCSLQDLVKLAQEDNRFEADLLLRLDSHEELDGFDAIAKKLLKKQGLALSLPRGKSWQRQGAKVLEVQASCGFSAISQ